MIKRHLLTLFVLLSGLAALQAPALASCDDTVAAHARSFSGGCEASDWPHASCAFVAEARAEAEETAVERPIALDTDATGLELVPYIFGVERALE